jgi:hypothetical protein
VGNLTELMELVLFLVLGVVGTWRFLTRGLVTEDLYFFAAFALVGVIMVIHAVVKRMRA